VKAKLIGVAQGCAQAAQFFLFFVVVFYFAFSREQG